jgi:hypothetical protein
VLARRQSQSSVRQRTDRERRRVRQVFSAEKVKTEYTMKHENLESRKDVRWEEPVWVQVGTGIPEKVASPADALEKLAFRWPSERRRHYLGVKKSCLAALKDQMESDLARGAFIRAAVEAGMLSRRG